MAVVKRSVFLNCSTAVFAAGTLTMTLIPAASWASEHGSVNHGSAKQESAVQSEAVSPALHAQSKAQATLKRAIDIAGGYDALSSLRSSTISFSTRNANAGQAPTPTSSPEFGNPTRSIAYRSNGRLAIENYNGDNLGYRYVRGVGPDWVYLAGQNAVAQIDPLVAPAILDRANTSANLLLAMADNSQNLRFAGTSQVDGVDYHVVNFADAIGRAHTVYFDAQSGQLSKSEYLSAHAQWGDIATTTIYSEFKDVNDITLSHKTSTIQAGVTTSEVSVGQIDFKPVDNALYIKPEGAGENDPFTAPSNAPRDLEVEILAKDIYFVANAAQGYNVIFVNNREGVTILETPQSIQTSRDVIRTIQATLPGKKIKRAVPTHHHFDHSGGIYGYQEAGISILTTPGNKKFVTDIGSASRNIGHTPGGSKKTKVETFDDKRTIGRGSRKVELINVGPNPHADEIVVAYLPAIKALFVADIFSARGNELPPANANQLAFAQALETLDLDIETFIPVHGSKTSAADFWDSVKRGREAAQSAANSGNGNR